MNITEIGTNQSGEQFFYDEDQEGPFGKPAIVNENGVVYDEKTHRRMADILIDTALCEMAKHQGDVMLEDIHEKFLNEEWIMETPLSERMKYVMDQNIEKKDLHHDAI